MYVYIYTYVCIQHTYLDVGFLQSKTIASAMGTCTNAGAPASDGREAESEPFPAPWPIKDIAHCHWHIK